jgi:hypothetical protein
VKGLVTTVVRIDVKLDKVLAILQEDDEEELDA